MSDLTRCYGVIRSIKEVDGYSLEGSNESWRTYEGFEINTDTDRILVLVSDQVNCCESWGYLSTPDNIQDFIGTQINRVTIVDEALEQKEVIKYLDQDNIIFVNFETDKGLFQLAVYNSHNGYYGHAAKVIIGGKIVLDGYL